MSLRRTCAVLSGAIFSLLLVGVARGTCVCSSQLCQLDKEQSALYLTCTMVAQGAQIPPKFTPDLLGTLNLLANERTAEFQAKCPTGTVSKLPALNGLNHLQLALEQITALKDYAFEQFPFDSPGKARAKVFQSFETMNDASCATDAQKFTVPNGPSIELSTNSLNFGNVPAGGFSFKDFRIVNRGKSQLTGKIDASRLNNAYSVFPTGPFSLKYGQVLDVGVQFNPPSKGNFGGVIRINSNDPIHPTETVTVSGSGV